MGHFTYPLNPMNIIQTEPSHTQGLFSNTPNQTAATSLKWVYPFANPLRTTFEPEEFYPHRKDMYQVMTPNGIKQQEPTNLSGKKRGPQSNHLKHEQYAILGKQGMEREPTLMDNFYDHSFYGFPFSQSDLGDQNFSTPKQWPQRSAVQSNISSSSQLDFVQWGYRMEDTKQSLEPRLNSMGRIRTEFEFTPYHHSEQAGKVLKRETHRGLTRNNSLLQAQFQIKGCKHRHSLISMNDKFDKTSTSQIIPGGLHSKHFNSGAGLPLTFHDKTATNEDHTMTYPRQNHSTGMAASTSSTNIPQPSDDRLELEFDYDSVEWSIKIVEHFIKLFQKEPNMTNEEPNLATLLGPPLINDEFADGFIAEMTMDKEEFDSLLFGNPMNMDTLPNDNRLQSTTDSGFFEEQTVLSNDTDFESVPTSPFSSHFSNSPSSESGIEEGDDEFDEKSIGSLDVSRDSTDFLTATTESLFKAPVSSPMDINMQPVPTEQQKTESSVAAAYEELKQLLYTVVPSSVQTSSSFAGMKNIMSETLGNTLSSTKLPVTLPMSTSVPSSIAGVLNAPVSTVACDSSTTIQYSTQDTLVSSIADVGNLASALNSPGETKSTSAPRCTKRARRGKERPKLVILDEPEENYRARYESEGCRGPIHGSSENTYPTIKVSGHSGPVWITVYLVTSSGQQHYHSIHGPGSTKVPCKELTLPGGIPAVQLMVDPDSKMTAVLDSLSIRRLRNWEGDKELRKRGIDPRTWKRERKEARLLFQAEIPASDGQPEIKLTCKSRIFQCSSSGPTGNPEIWWTSRTEGSVEGNEEMGLIGKKFPSGCKVRFSVDLPSGAIWEKFADVDKSKSHQGAAVIQTPPYRDQDILLPVTVNVEIVNGNNVKSGKCSEPIEFTYRPRKEIVTSILTNGRNITTLGGTKTETEGGTTTTAPQTLNSSMVNPMTPMSVSPVVPIAPKQPDENDWQKLCIQIKELQLNGELNCEQIKKLCAFIQRRDMLLLQTFRSANNAGTQEERLTKLKQYLTGLVGNS